MAPAGIVFIDQTAMLQHKILHALSAAGKAFAERLGCDTQYEGAFFARDIILIAEYKNNSHFPLQTGQDALHTTESGLLLHEIPFRS